MIGIVNKAKTRDESGIFNLQITIQDSLHITIFGKKVS